jgi:hypothetical protein
MTLRGLALTFAGLSVVITLLIAVTVALLVGALR